MLTWDAFYVEMARLLSRKSKDRSTQVGAVIVGGGWTFRSGGYNGFPRHVNDELPERHERPAKYLFAEHAERNAIYNAARSNIPIAGCAMYLMFGPGPCADCARAIIQAGIVEVVMPKNNDFPGKGAQWEESIAAGTAMLKEAGIRIRFVDV